MRYILEQLPGRNIEEKIANLKRDILKNDRTSRDILLKTSHNLRNIGAHDIKQFPESTEALSLLSDAITIFEKIWCPYERSKK